jgi:Icc protein
MRVAHITDTHLKRSLPDSSNQRNPDACLERTVAALMEHRPDVVLLTGDIADDASVEGCERAKAIIGRLGVPILATAGNHDTSVVVARVFGVADVLTESWSIVVVDTSVAGKEAGRVDVEATVASIDTHGDRPVLVAVHHPPITLSSHRWFQLDGASDLVVELQRRPNVRAVVSGHLHQAFAVQLDHVSYIGGPSAWYAIAHTGDTWAEAQDGLVGANLYNLGDDGTFSWMAVPRFETACRGRELRETHDRHRDIRVGDSG